MPELSNALRRMKNNKTPGMDGFPSEFFKVFWSKLSFFILRSINLSYKIGKLPLSMRQCIINCIPKGDKPREFLKNWRPISLLPVIYKLASSVIAGRIKTVLPKVISPTQSGFVDGRFIGDTTRLVYDIMSEIDNRNLDGLLMLIDFEKAFDSISWRFMYNVFQYLGFGPDILAWIKLFNTDITASVLQMGVLSRFFQIQRGCKQGDPIASVEFILCAQILYLMIYNNKEIKGIIIDNKEFKMSQFADDTTIFLDGTQRSLEAALNTIEIYGSYSGLKLNKSKTKLIWIGRKKHSKDKLNVTMHLDWGHTQFTLLGLKYDVDLQKIPLLNFQSAKIDIIKTIETWNKRNLTPFGKITIIKTYLLSKLNHLFMSIPSPSNDFFKDISSILYKFIWDNKPDKVKRTVLCQNYYNGGLQMIDIEKFVTAMKSTWVRRLLDPSDMPWKCLFELTISNIRNIRIYGSSFFKLLKSKTNNQFWKDVFVDWNNVYENYKVKNNDHIMTQPLWHNPRISVKGLHFPNWSKCGILFVSDIVNNNGSILDHNDISHLYPDLKSNFLEYYRLKKQAEAFIQKNKVNNDFDIPRPILPHHLQLLNHNTKGCKFFLYRLQISPLSMTPKFMGKWNRDFNMILDGDTWKQIFKCCFKTLDNNELIWFQYRILHRILGTNHLRYKMNQIASPVCNQCQQSDQTLLHLFTECSTYTPLWDQLQHWIRQTTNINITLNPQKMLLGYLLSDNSSNPINTILMVTKYYIFTTARNSKLPNIIELKKIIKNNYEEQLLLVRLGINKLEYFNKTWLRFKHIFEI